MLQLSLTARIRQDLASQRVLKTKTSCVPWIGIKIHISVKTNQVFVHGAAGAESSLHLLSNCL